MERMENWPEALNAYIDTIRGAPFSWGDLDCCLFAANCVRAMTGEDPASFFRGKYADEAGAVAALQEYGTPDVGAIMEKMAAEYGWEEVGPSFMSRGDVCIVSQDEGSALAAFGGLLAICVGPVIFAMAKTGLVAVPIKSAARAWHVR